MVFFQDLGIIGAAISGFYSILIFIMVSKFVPVKEWLAFHGVFNKWVVLAVLLFEFGYIKHEVGYYFAIESNYCENTKVCSELFIQSQPTYIDRVKIALGATQNLLVENIAEGLVFVLVGMPMFVFIADKRLAAFITGAAGHLISKYSGFHQHFCRTTCSANPFT